MHIAMWSPGWPLEKYQNGIVTFVDAMKKELAVQGHRVSVFAPPDGGAAPSSSVHLVKRGPVGRFARRALYRLFPIERDLLTFGEIVADAVLEVHRRDPIDVIEIEESFGWSEDVARITKIPTLVKLHGPAFLSMLEEDLVTPRGRARVEREGRALALASAIAAPSSLTLQQTIARYGLSPKITEHVVNPVSTAGSMPVWEASTSQRDTILFVGRFDRRKGADIVLGAFRELLAARPNLRLVFVGPDAGLAQAAGGAPVHFEAYRDAVFPPELRSRIDYRGRMPNHEIAALRPSAAVTVIASRWENQGYTVLEAMLQGCPVVCSDAGGCPESVIHGQTGLLARSEDAADFAAKINAMLDDPAAAAAMGAAARRHVLEHHSAERVAKQSLAVYERMIAHARQ
jgi:glycosyltransferase involved in cell wall biosynthesis